VTPVEVVDFDLFMKTKNLTPILAVVELEVELEAELLLRVQLKFHKQ
jgi:hypothetical protein